MRPLAWFILTICGWKEPDPLQLKSKKTIAVYRKENCSFMLLMLYIVAFPQVFDNINFKVHTSYSLLPYISEIFIKHVSDLKYKNSYTLWTSDEDEDVCFQEKIDVGFDYAKKQLNFCTNVFDTTSYSYIDYPTLTSFVSSLIVVPELYSLNLYLGVSGTILAFLFFFYNYSFQTYFEMVLKITFLVGGLLMPWMFSCMNPYAVCLSCVGLYLLKHQRSHSYLCLAMSIHVQLTSKYI